MGTKHLAAVIGALYEYKTGNFVGVRGIFPPCRVGRHGHHSLSAGHIISTSFQCRWVSISKSPLHLSRLTTLSRPGLTYSEGFKPLSRIPSDMLNLLPEDVTPVEKEMAVYAPSIWESLAIQLTLFLGIHFGREGSLRALSNQY